MVPRMQAPLFLVLVVQEQYARNFWMNVESLKRTNRRMLCTYRDRNFDKNRNFMQTTLEGGSLRASKYRKATLKNVFVKKI